MPWKMTPYDTVRDSNGLLEFYAGPLTGTSHVPVHNYEHVKGFRCESTAAERRNGTQQPHLREHLRYKSSPCFATVIVSYDSNGDPIYGTKAIDLESSFANRPFEGGGSIATMLSDFESQCAQVRRDVENKMTSFSRGVEADMLVTVGEAVQTRKLIADALSTLAGVVKRVKAPDNDSIIRKVMDRMRRNGYSTHWNDRIQKMFLRECQKEIASAWLVYRYAVMPACYTIRDLTGAWIKQQSEALMKGKPIGAGASIDDYTKTYLIRNPSLVETFGSGSATLVFKASFRYVGSAWLCADQFERFGVDSLNQYIRAAWELTPHSFWIDWCCDIAGLIDQLVPPDFPIRNCGFTEVQSREIEITFRDGNHHWSLKQKSRVIKPPSPTWAPQQPIQALWGETYKRYRVIDTVALIRQFRH